MSFLQFRIIPVAVLLVLFTFSSAPAADTRCAECGMIVNISSNFTARLVQADKTLFFCDIGDLFTYLKRKAPKDFKAEVKDFLSSEWIDARKAYFVHEEKKFRSPMGWGTAAFLDRNEASKSGNPMDFDSTIKTLK
jgi:nitrous oxide reductase accessory protein NosL